MPEGGDNVDMCVYISLSINQKATDLSPTKACVERNKVTIDK